MEVVTFECGVDIDEFEDSTAVADLGLDSLIGIIIAAMMREWFGIQADLSLFREYPTVGSLKTYLATAEVLSKPGYM